MWNQPINYIKPKSIETEPHQNHFVTVNCDKQNNNMLGKTRKTKRHSNFTPVPVHDRVSHYVYIPLTQSKTTTADELYVYSSPPVDCEAPLPPSRVDLHQAGFIQHIRKASVLERAGGYEESIGCCRAMQEAMIGLSFGAVKSNSGSADVADGLVAGRHEEGETGSYSGTDEYNVQLSFDEAILGTSLAVQVRCEGVCDTCVGSKSELGYIGNICSYCEWTGEETDKTDHITARKTCSLCEGSKVFIKYQCNECKGTGRKLFHRLVTVDIPPSTVHGQVLRIELDFQQLGLLESEWNTKQMLIRVSVGGSEQLVENEIDLKTSMTDPVSRAGYTTSPARKAGGTHTPSGTRTSKPSELKENISPNTEDKSKTWNRKALFSSEMKGLITVTPDKVFLCTLCQKRFSQGSLRNYWPMQFLCAGGDN